MAEEKNFENRIKAYLDSKSCWYVKYFANGFTKKGIPDLLACVNGRFVAIEVKASKGKASELQKHEISKIHDAGGIAMILYPSEFDAFKLIVEELLKG